MSGSGRGFKKKYEVKTKYYDAEALIKLFYPDSQRETNEHPLKNSLKARLSIEEGFLLRSEQVQKPLDEKKLEDQIRSKKYECCVLEMADEKHAPLVGYRLYCCASKSARRGSSKLLTIDTVIQPATNLLRDEKDKEPREDRVIEDTSLLLVLEKVEKIKDKPGIDLKEKLEFTVNSAEDIKKSLTDLALHVRSKTSLWYAGFFGSRKEAELKHIADNIQEEKNIPPEKVQKYLLDIAYVAMQTRGFHLSMHKQGSLLVTKSGQAFMREIFSPGGQFANLKGYFNIISLPGAASESAVWVREDERKEEEFYVLYEKVRKLAGLALKATECGLGFHKKIGSLIEPTEVESVANPYRRSPLS